MEVQDIKDELPNKSCLFWMSSLLLFLPCAVENTRQDGLPKAENGNVGDAKHTSM